MEHKRGCGVIGRYDSSMVRWIPPPGLPQIPKKGFGGGVV
jgi:hypothetical protein